MSFEVKTCEVLYYGPHRAIAGRITGVVRVKIHESFMGTETEYGLDLKVRAETGPASSSSVVRQALVAHAARQLNRIKALQATRRSIAAE